MKEYIKPEIEFVQMVTEDVTVSMGTKPNPWSLIREPGEPEEIQ